MLWNIFLVDADNFTLKEAHRNALFEYNFRKHSATQEKPVDAIHLTSQEDIERVITNIIKNMLGANTTIASLSYIKILLISFSSFK